MMRLLQTIKVVRCHRVVKPANLHACAVDYHLSEWFDL